MSKKMILLKVFVFITILIMLLQITSMIFIPKNNSKKAGMQQATAYGFLSEKKNTIDMVVIGDSEAYSAISPMQIYKEHGYTSYVCSAPRQQLYEAYHLLTQVFKTQQPKLVILETNPLFRHANANDVVLSKGMQQFPVLQYHDRWKKITKEDFMQTPEYNENITYKGFRFNRQIKASKVKNHMKKINNNKHIPLFNQYYFQKIYQLCKDKEIELILLSTPSTKNWNYAKHNSVYTLASQYQCQYLDLNLVSSLHIDWKHDTRDQGDHMNYYGAYKVTRYLGQYLSKTHLLSDHRHDNDYKQWQIDLQQYEKDVKKKTESH